MKFVITGGVNITEKNIAILVKKDILLKLPIIYTYEIRKNYISCLCKNRIT